MCNCRLCKRSRKFDDVMKRVQQKDHKWFKDLYTELINVEADLEYKDAIMSGQWPSSVEILERCLEKARAHESQSPSNV